MGALIRAHAWEFTPLGPPEGWPQSLRSALSICLHSSFPTAIYWGPGLHLLYNDAWAPIPAERHPAALGRPAAEVWADIWPVVGPQFAQVLATGEGFSTFDQLLPMVRDGHIAETYWNYSFTPIRGEDGSVAGIFNQGHETTERVLADRRRTAETDRLRRMFDLAPGFMALLSGPEHVFELTNAAYMQLIGHRPVLGRTVRDALPEVAGQGYFELLDTVFATGQPFVGRALAVRLQRSPGSETEERFVDLLYQPVTDAAGTVTGVFVEGSDVTDRVLAEAELRASEGRLRALLNASSDAVFRMSPDWTELRQLEGRGFIRTIQAVSSRWLEDYLFPEDRPQILAAVQDAVQRRGVFELEHRLRRVDGSEGWAFSRAIPVLDAQGEVTEWFGMAADVTPRKRAEAERDSLLRALEAERTRLAAILEYMPVGVGITDAEGRMMMTNPSMRQFVGERVPSGDPQSADHWVGHHPDGRPIAPIDFPAARALRGERVVPGIEFLFRAGRRECWTRVAAVPVPSEDGDVMGAVVLVEDIDAWKRAERQRELLHGELNHRVKNILATVQGLAAQTLKGAAGDPRRFAKDFGARLRTLARAHDLLNVNSWEPTTIEETVLIALEPWLDSGGASRVGMSGACLGQSISPRQAQILVLALHELATNATKYGALSVPQGHAEIRCVDTAEGGVELLWSESGGPPVAVPSERRGFGTRLLEHGVARELGPRSVVTLHFDPSGLRAAIRFTPVPATG